MLSIDTELKVNGSQLKGTDFGINFEQFFNAQIQEKYLFYGHLDNGSEKGLTNEIRIEYPYSNYPLKETIVDLAFTPKEFERQKWEGNCNRLGGDPIWVQEPEKLKCPNCVQDINYIFQLDSGLPDLNERNSSGIMFGNDGMLYAFWCDKARISGCLWHTSVMSHQRKVRFASNLSKIITIS